MTPSPSRNRGVAETIHENAGLAARYGIRSTPTVVLSRRKRSSTGSSARRPSPASSRRQDRALPRMRHERPAREPRGSGMGDAYDAPLANTSEDHEAERVASLTYVDR